MAYEDERHEVRVSHQQVLYTLRYHVHDTWLVSFLFSLFQRLDNFLSLAVEFSSHTSRVRISIYVSRDHL